MPPDAPLRLSLLTTWGEKCGIATYSEALAEGLAQHDVEVSVVAPQLRRADQPRGEQPIRVWRRNRAGLLDAWRAFQQIRAQRADVVHVQITTGIVSPTFLLGLARLCRREKLPLFATLHEAGGGSLARRLKFAAVRRALRSAQLILHSPDPDFPAAQIIAHGMAEIPHRPRAVARQELGVAEDALVMAHFGFIHPDKGIEAVLHAVAELRESRFPHLQYRICGGTFTSAESRGHLAHLQELAKTLGLTDAVYLTGEFASEDRVTLEMQAADCVVLNYLTGNRQGASGAAHRALAAGSALAVSQAPIFDNLREAAHTMKEPLLEELQALLGSPEMRAGITARAARFCDERRWVRVGAKHAELYLRALGRGSLQ